MRMKFWLWTNFVGFVMLDHGKFCGYDIGYVGIYLCMDMDMWEFFFFWWLSWSCRNFFDGVWLWEKFGSCVWTCEKFLIALKFLVGALIFYFILFFLLWEFLDMWFWSWKFFLDMWFWLWNNGLNIYVAKPQELR